MNPKTLIPILPSPNHQSAFPPCATSGAHLVDPVTPACDAIAASEPFGAPPVDTRALLEQLTAIAASVTSGDMNHPESMLVAQATALNVVFSRLTARAMKSDNLELATPMLRLAFRAQAQCSRALQTLTSMRYPAIFARQLNIANQQVVANISTPAPTPPLPPSTAAPAALTSAGPPLFSNATPCRSDLWGSAALPDTVPSPSAPTRGNPCPSVRQREPRSVQLQPPIPSASPRLRVDSRLPNPENSPSNPLTPNHSLPNLVRFPNSNRPTPPESHLPMPTPTLPLPPPPPADLPERHSFNRPTVSHQT